MCVQDAINNAEPGDLIEMMQGTYDRPAGFNLTFYKKDGMWPCFPPRRRSHVSVLRNLDSLGTTIMQWLLYVLQIAGQARPGCWMVHAVLTICREFSCLVPLQSSFSLGD